MKKPTNKKKRVVKGWAVVAGSAVFSAYRYKDDADVTKSRLILKGWKVVPCTISYSLPTKKITKKR